MSYGEMPATTNYKCYYKFEGDLNDFSGNARTLTGVSNTYGVSKLGTQAMNLASSQYAYRNDNLGINGGPITVILWYKYASNSTNNGDIVSIFGGSNKVYYEFYYVSDAPGALLWGRSRRGVTEEGPTATMLFSTTAWTHVAGTYDGSYMTMWINGEKFGPTAASGNGTTSSSDGTIVGCWRAAATPSGFMRGLYDDLIIEGRAWTEQEVKNHYALGRGLRCPKIS
jgi:hypothetical protein